MRNLTHAEVRGQKQARHAFNSVGFFFVFFFERGARCHKHRREIQNGAEESVSRLTAAGMRLRANFFIDSENNLCLSAFFWGGGGGAISMK